MTPADPNPTRQAFEKAAQRHADKAGIDFTRLAGSGEYKYLRLQFMWVGWQMAMQHEGKLTTAVDDKADNPDAHQKDCQCQACTFRRAGKTTTAPVEGLAEQEDPLL